MGAETINRSRFSSVYKLFALMLRYIDTKVCKSISQKQTSTFFKSWVIQGLAVVIVIDDDQAVHLSQQKTTLLCTRILKP